MAILFLLIITFLCLNIKDNVLEKKLDSLGAVLIQGVKWCRKSTTTKEKARSFLALDDPSRKKQNLEMADTDPEKLFFKVIIYCFDLFLCSEVLK